MNLLRFDAESTWVHTICSLWRDRLRTNPDLTICLPTGSTPTAIYEEMSRSVRTGLVSFARARVFALDEFGGLAADDPGRTRHTLQRQLIDRIDLSSAAFHFLDPDARDLVSHCRDYDVGVGDGFDLVLLGIGTNGHLGMNEPGSPADSPTRRVDLHDATIQSSVRYFTHTNLPRWGLTIGLQGILAAREVWVLANGARKAEIVERTVRGEIGAANPASLLRHHPNCSMFIDDTAAALLNTAGS